jgi:hypothetical protein
MSIFSTIKVTGKDVLLHAKQAQKGGIGITLPIFDPSARRGWVVSGTPKPLYPHIIQSIASSYTNYAILDATVS